MLFLTRQNLLLYPANANMLVLSRGQLRLSNTLQLVCDIGTHQNCLKIDPMTPHCTTRVIMIGRYWSDALAIWHSPAEAMSLRFKETAFRAQDIMDSL